METRQSKDKKRDALIKAAEGFYLLLIAVLPLTLTQSIEISIGDWFFAIAATTAIWVSMILLIETNVDRFFSFFDPHFLLIPAAAASFLINYYIYLMPELRVLVLGGWFTVLIFGGSLYTLRQALWLSSIMGAGYLISLILVQRKGYALDMSIEVAMAIPFWAFWAYCAKMIQEHRTRRKENINLRKELMHFAFFDQLTGIGNRRKFNELFERTLEDIGHEQQFAVALFDIDHFKEINDQRGHSAGDKALIRFSAALNKVFKGREIPCRLGGDEFAVIIHYENRAALLERMDDLFFLLRSELGGLFTVSCGLAITSARYSESRALRIADSALYQAKKEGRDQYHLQDLDEVTKALSRAATTT